MVDELFAIGRELEKLSASVDWVCLLGDEIESRLVEPVVFREPVRVAAATGGGEVEIFFHRQLMAVVMASHIEKRGNHLGWHLPVKQPQQVDGLEQSFDLWIGPCTSEWVHRIDVDSPILDKACLSGHIPCLVRPKNPKMLQM